MNLRHVEFSIVVVGQDCNPTILNPDFLRYRGIVPEEWGWEMEGPAITTPAFSTVPYGNGVVVSVEPQKFITVHRLKGTDPLSSRIPEIAKKYVGELPHVRYLAVGINIKSFMEQEEPERFLRQRFLKPGTWDSESHLLERLGIKFGYAHPGGKLTLSLDGAEAKDIADGKAKVVHGVSVAANFHRECDGYPTDKQVIAHVEKWKGDISRYLTIATDVLEK